MFSVGLSHEDTIGWISMGVLWIFFKTYSLAGWTFLALLFSSLLLFSALQGEGRVAG